MTIIAPLRKDVVAPATAPRPDGGAVDRAPDKPKRKIPNMKRYSWRTELQHAYVPVEPRILEWTSPTGTVCWWDANGFFCVPLQGKGVRVSPVASPKITRSLTHEQKWLIYNARRRFRRRIERRETALMNGGWT